VQVTSEDPAVKQAMIANLMIDAFVTVAGLALLAYQLRGGELGEMVKRKLRNLRDSIFGPPPPTEEQIRQMVRQLHIEVARFERGEAQ